MFNYGKLLFVYATFTNIIILFIYSLMLTLTLILSRIYFILINIYMASADNSLNLFLSAFVYLVIPGPIVIKT